MALDNQTLTSNQRFRVFRNISVYPVCVEDVDCQDMTSKTGLDHRCFMYMCFPWENNPGPIRSCWRTSDCVALTESEGGDGGDGDCYRHYARREVFRGICVRKEELVQCDEHAHCAPDLRCVNWYCGENSYFEALHDCSDDTHCQVRGSITRSPLCVFFISVITEFSARRQVLL